MPRQATEQADLHEVRYCSCSLENNGKFYYQYGILEKPLL